jgi:hypothetical protein
MWTNICTCSTYFTYSSIFENCFRSIIIYIYTILLKCGSNLIYNIQDLKQLYFEYFLIFHKKAFLLINLLAATDSIHATSADQDQLT